MLSMLANKVGNAGSNVRQAFLNDVFTFLTEVGNEGRIVNTGTSSVNSEFVTADYNNNILKAIRLSQSPVGVALAVLRLPG
jgi:hypothetical protein